MDGALLCHDDRMSPAAAIGMEGEVLITSFGLLALLVGEVSSNG
jgi:hypothetical protein